MSGSSEKELETALTLLEEAKPEEAKKILAGIYEFNLDNQEIEFAIWCCNYWADFFRHFSDMEPEELGERLLFKWKEFSTSLSQKKEVFKRAVFSVQTGVFTQALHCFSKRDEFQQSAQKSEILLKKGICHKKLGQYKQALTCLDEANRISQGQAEILAEMADCYALCGMEKQAKVLFRESFFIDAKKINLAFLDSQLIKCLIGKTEEKGFSGEELQYWIPVYGVLYGVLNVTRKLRSQEAGKLRQEIFETEVEIKNPASNAKILKPKLLFMYFRLMDYYVQKGGMENEISELLLHIKILDPDIYKIYAK